MRTQVTIEVTDQDIRALQVLRRHFPDTPADDFYAAGARLLARVEEALPDPVEEYAELLYEVFREACNHRPVTWDRLSDAGLRPGFIALAEHLLNEERDAGE